MTSYLANIWSATEFRTAELASYAEPQIRKDTRHGIQILALLSLSMNICVGLLVARNATGALPLYSQIALVVLSLHILISARFVDDIGALQGLGMVLLIVTALAIIFIAHGTGELSIGMMAAIVMLLISIPLVPWALREATIVIGLTIVLLTSSLVSVPGRFNQEAFWLLELLVLGSTVIVGILVARNTAVRKQDIRVRFELESARREMELLSLKDHLTGAWNRRYLAESFAKYACQCLEQEKTVHVAILDIDDFKGVNDRFGHDIGDEILVNVAETFVRLIGNRGHLIRLGGDEFQIVYCGDDLDELINSAVSALQQNTIVNELTSERTITLSAGIASTATGQLADLADLYKRADCALYEAKQECPAVAGLTSDLTHTGTWKL